MYACIYTYIYTYICNLGQASYYTFILCACVNGHYGHHRQPYVSFGIPVAPGQADFLAQFEMAFVGSRQMPRLLRPWTSSTRKQVSTTQPTTTLPRPGVYFVTSRMPKLSSQRTAAYTRHLKAVLAGCSPNKSILVTSENFEVIQITPHFLAATANHASAASGVDSEETHHLEVAWATQRRGWSLRPISRATLTGMTLPAAA